MLASIRKLNWSVDPQTSASISALFVVVGLLAAASPSIFPSYIPSGWVADTIQTAGFITFIWNGVQTMLHNFSSTQPGPWAPQDPIKPPMPMRVSGSGVNALAFLALLAGASMFFMASAPQPADAATLHVTKCGRAGCPTPAPAFAPGVVTPPSTPSLGGLEAFTVADLQAALALAQAQTPPDTRHGACWQAAIPVAQAWQLPNILPPSPGLATLVQTYFDDMGLVNKPLIPDSVVEACALTVYDLNTSMAAFALALGVHVIQIPKLPVL